MTEPVVIVDYDLHWPSKFEVEKERLLNALVGRGARVEHIGSTSVPGLAAKPIIDIMVGLPTMAAVDDAVSHIQAIGYQYVPEFEEVMPERRYFRRGTPRSHQIHMVALKGDFWCKHLQFRDYLRAHDDAAAAYAELKRNLASHYAHDREGYTGAKSSFIAEVLARAEGP